MEPKKIGWRSKNFSRNSLPSRPMLPSWPVAVASDMSRFGSLSELVLINVEGFGTLSTELGRMSAMGH